MTDQSPKAFLLSVTLHGAVIALAVLLSFAANRPARHLPKVLELVAGEGDNYGAKVAPALGTPGGITLDLPAPRAPTPAPEPPKAPPPKAEPSPMKPAPAKAAEPPAVPNFKKQIQRTIIRADSQAKLDIKKQRAAEAKRLKEEQKRMTKEEFDRANRAKASPHAAPAKVAKIDTEGIAKGVVGGSRENKVGGVGGKALVSDNNDVLAAYDALLRQRLQQAFEPPPGLSENLVAEVRVQSNADGSLTAAKILTSSGSAEFDRAVLDAIRKTRMPARPDGKSEPIKFPFTMRERDGG